METKLIIIEGMDNTGKSTLIDRLTKILDLLELTFKVIHSEKPPKDIPAEETAAYQHKYYFKLIKEIAMLKNEFDYIILDRAWLSEYVYGQMYRDRSALEIITDNIIMDKKAMQTFKGSVYLYTLVASPEFLIWHDDNKSLSNKDKRLIQTELNLFKKGFNLSLIGNKSIINVDENMTTFKDVLPIICNQIID